MEPKTSISDPVASDPVSFCWGYDDETLTPQRFAQRFPSLETLTQQRMTPPNLAEISQTQFVESSHSFYWGYDDETLTPQRFAQRFPSLETLTQQRQTPPREGGREKSVRERREEHKNAGDSAKSPDFPKLDPVISILQTTLNSSTGSSSSRAQQRQTPPREGRKEKSERERREEWIRSYTERDGYYFPRNYPRTEDADEPDSDSTESEPDVIDGWSRSYRLKNKKVNNKRAREEDADKKGADEEHKNA